MQEELHVAGSTPAGGRKAAVAQLAEQCFATIRLRGTGVWNSKRIEEHGESVAVSGAPRGMQAELIVTPRSRVRFPPGSPKESVAQWIEQGDVSLPIVPAA